MLIGVLIIIKETLIFNSHARLSCGNMKDYVIASGNEKEFVSMGEKLGYSELVFIGKADLSKIKTKLKLTTSTRIFKSSSKDRELIESKKADVIYEFEQEQRKDHTHFRNSGINQVIAKLMKDKKVIYGISFNQILKASPKEQAVLLGRMMQNIRIFRKYKVSMIVGSFASNPYEMRDFKDLVSFAKTLGLNEYKA